MFHAWPIFRYASIRKPVQLLFRTPNSTMQILENNTHLFYFFDSNLLSGVNLKSSTFPKSNHTLSLSFFPILPIFNPLIFYHLIVIISFFIISFFILISFFLISFFILITGFEKYLQKGGFFSTVILQFLHATSVFKWIREFKPKQVSPIDFQKLNRSHKAPPQDPSKKI